QAEDGIRDGHVTGVQTCALPISSLAIVPGTAAYTMPADFYQLLSARLKWGPTDIEELSPVGVRDRTDLDMITTFARWTPKAYRRSEERRVGKEWRSRVWAE